MNAFKFHAPYMYSEKIEWFKVTFLKIEWCNAPLEPPPTGALRIMHMIALNFQVGLKNDSFQV